MINKTMNKLKEFEKTCNVQIIDNDDNIVYVLTHYDYLVNSLLPSIKYRLVDFENKLCTIHNKIYNEIDNMSDDSLSDLSLEIQSLWTDNEVLIDEVADLQRYIKLNKEQVEQLYKLNENICKTYKEFDSQEELVKHKQNKTR